MSFDRSLCFIWIRFRIRTQNAKNCFFAWNRAIELKSNWGCTCHIIAYLPKWGHVSAPWILSSGQHMGQMKVCRFLLCFGVQAPSSDRADRWESAGNEETASRLIWSMVKNAPRKLLKAVIFVLIRFILRNLPQPFFPLMVFPPTLYTDARYSHCH